MLIQVSNWNELVKFIKEETVFLKNKYNVDSDFEDPKALNKSMIEFSDKIISHKDVCEQLAIANFLSSSKSWYCEGRSNPYQLSEKRAEEAGYLIYRIILISIIRGAFDSFDNFVHQKNVENSYKVIKTFNPFDDEKLGLTLAAIIEIVEKDLGISVFRNVLIAATAHFDICVAPLMEEKQKEKEEKAARCSYKGSIWEDLRRYAGSPPRGYYYDNFSERKPWQSQNRPFFIGLHGDKIYLNPVDSPDWEPYQEWGKS